MMSESQLVARLLMAGVPPHDAFRLASEAVWVRDACLRRRAEEERALREWEAESARRDLEPQVVVPASPPALWRALAQLYATDTVEFDSVPRSSVGARRLAGERFLEVRVD